MGDHGDRPAIELRAVHKAFGSQTVLNGVDLAVRPRESVAVLGRSGAGKSVLLKLIIGLQQPDAGTIQIHGQATAGLAPDQMDAVRMKIGYLFQEGALYDSLSIEDNVAFPLRHHRDDLSGADLRSRVHELLTVVGMEKDAAKRPAEISGGMKKRVGLARALALEPDILLFDEPTSGLDPITAGEIEELMLKLKQERDVASILVTHDVHGARAVADRVALINDGTIVAEGTFEELAESRDPFVSEFLGEGSVTMTSPFRLGLFIVTTLSMLAVATFLIGERQFLFTRTYRLNTTFSTVAGLVAGAEVRVGGLHKGTVDRITLPADPDGDVTVLMKLERSTVKVLRADSVASIETEGLLGAKYVAISFGSDDAPAVTDGAGIRGEDPLDMPELMKTAGAVLNNVRDGSASLRDIAAKVNAGEGTLGALVNDKRMYTAARGGATAFQENMEALRHNFLLRGFFNDRGYQDSAKLRQDEIPKLPPGTPVRTFRFDVLKIFADADHAKLKGEKQLKDAGQYLQATPFDTVVVVAASGMKGDADEVRVLTQARAMVVRDYLVKNFQMDDRRIKTMGLGKTEGLASEAGTVEILVFGNGK